jgi:hypothetical protein
MTGAVLPGRGAGFHLKLQLEAAGRPSFPQGSPKLEELQLQLEAAERFRFLPGSPLASTNTSLPGPTHALLPDLALGSPILQQSSHQFPRVLKSLATRRKGRIGMFPQVGTALHCIAQNNSSRICQVQRKCLTRYFHLGSQKLHKMLVDLEESGDADIACFISPLPGFIIRKPAEFVKNVMPKYFQGMSRYESFLCCKCW